MRYAGDDINEDDAAGSGGLWISCPIVQLILRAVAVLFVFFWYQYNEFYTFFNNSYETVIHL